MKKLFLLIRLIILISSQTFSQTEWEYIGLADPNIGEIFDIEIDANGNIYAGALLGPIYKSTDNGATWELKNNGLPANAAIGEAIAIYQNQIYLTTNQGLYKSTNFGDNWFRIAQSIPFLDFDEVRVIPNGYVFTSVFNMGTGGVFRSTDEGNTWEATSFTGCGAQDMGINRNGVMFFCVAALSWYAIYRSFDLGMTWEMLSPWMATRSLEYLRDGSVLAGVEGNGPGTLPEDIYKTTDNGNTWFRTNTFSGFNIFPDFVLDINDDIYVTNGEVYLSIDNGNSWEYRGLSNDVFCLAIDSSGYLYAGTLNDGIFRTPGRTTPVEIISFTAIVNDRDIELSWLTATETNNTGFEILRGIYAKRNRRTQNYNDDWEKIGFVTGHGTTTETQHYSFTDNDVKPGNYQYKLKQIDYDGTFEYSPIVEVEIPIVNKFSLSQNFPNPFNPVTKIKYQIPLSPPLLKGESEARGFVTLKVYDILGREVATLVNEEKPAGEYEVEFNAVNLPSGIYFYQLKAGQFSETKKMILLK